MDELRQPVDTARSNLDYVPTQVFSEYFLRVFDQENIRGIAWRSAATADGNRCLALDVSHEDCVDEPSTAADRPSCSWSPERRPSTNGASMNFDSYERR